MMLSVEHSSTFSSDAEQLVNALAQIQVPHDLTQHVLELSKQFGPELLTAILGSLSIYLTNRGSSLYGKIRRDMNPEEKRLLTKEASERIVLGSIGMTTIAFAAGNALFACPEVIAVLCALKPYIESSFPKTTRIIETGRMDVLLKAAAIGVGIYTTHAYAEHPMQALPPIGLTALSIAFSGKHKEEFYRLCTLSGGTTLTVGSFYATQEAMQANNTVGAIMSMAFLTLNALFTNNEWKEIQKIGGIKTLAQRIYESVKNLLGISRS